MLKSCLPGSYPYHQHTESPRPPQSNAILHGCMQSHSWRERYISRHLSVIRSRLWLFALSIPFPDAENDAVQIELATFSPVGKGPQNTTWDRTGVTGWYLLRSIISKANRLISAPMTSTASSQVETFTSRSRNRQGRQSRQILDGIEVGRGVLEGEFAQRFRGELLQN